MNYHRTKSGNRSALRVLAVTVLMLVALVLTFTVAASADGPAQSVIEVTADNFTFTGVTLKDGVYTKTYDGTTAVTVAPNSAVALKGVDATDLDKVTLTVESAAFNSKDVVGATHITVRYKLEVADSVKYKYSFGETVLTVPAKIEPVKLTWSVGSANATVTYIPGASQFPIDYNGLDAKPKLSGFIGTEGSGITYSVSPITAANAGTVGLTSKVYATGVSTNYTVTDTAVVNVKVEKVKITIIEQNWKDGSSNLDFSKLASAGHSYEYGDALPNINIVTDQYDDVLKLTSAAGYRAGVKGCDIGSYEFKIELLDTQNYEISGKTSVSIHLAAHLITDITLEESMTVVLGSETPSFTIKVNGKDLPEDLLNAITFKKDGQAFNGVIDSYGVFEIVAYLPEGNYTFNKTELKTTVTVLRSEKSFDVLNEAGEKVGTVILVNRDGFSDDVTVTAKAKNGYPDIVKNNKYNLVYTISISGAAEGATFSLIIPVTDAILAPGNDPLTAESLCIYEAATDTLTTALEAGRGYTVTLADGHYTVDGFTGVGDTTFVVSPNYTVPFFYTVYGIILIIVLVVLLLIAIFYRGLVLRRSLETKQDDPIVIDTVGVLPEHEMPTFEPRPEVDMDAAIEQKVEEVATNVDASLYEEKVEVTDEELQTVVDEAMSDLNDEVALIELESKEDAIVAEIADAIAEEIAEEGATEEATEEVADSEALDEAVAEAVEEVLEEAATEETAEETEEAEVTEEADAADESVLELEEAPAEEVAEEATEEVTEEVTEEAAEEATEEVTEEVTEEAAEEAVEEATEETAEEVTEEAAEEVTEEVTEEAPVETPVESETENDEDNSDDDNDDDDDGDAEAVEASTTVEDDPFGFGGPVADPATFVDVKENPEAYREMLEREARGEIRIVSRFKKSFQSKLSQSQGNVQDYYSELKNALLSFKGVKSRMSWNYEAFNKGRTHVAKMDAKAKTLYLYLALDPEAYAGTKYGVVNVSHKKKYASTPTLMKIKGDRKFKYALELISVMCGEQMTLPKMEIENVDYRIPRMTIEEMVEAGILKHNAGYIPLVEEAPAETVETVETVEAVEATDVETVINEEVAPVEAVEAVEAVEEAPVEETEAITADAVEATNVAVDEPAEDAEVVEEAPATETADATEPTEN